MLSEKAIIKLSLMAIFVGLAGIYLTILFIEPAKVSLSEINELLVGEVLTTEGQIKSFRLSNTSTAFITLEDEGKELLVIKFNSDNLELEKGDSVLVTGEITRYEGKIELVAREIKTN